MARQIEKTRQMPGQLCFQPLALGGLAAGISNFHPGWSEVAQSCPTLCNPMDCSLPGFSIHGIFQARVLEWVAISFSRGSSQPRDQTHLLHCRQTLYSLSHQETKTLVFSCMELSHIIPKVCLSLVSGPCYASFLHSARLPCAVPKRTCWGKNSGRRSSSALGAQVSLWGGEYSCPPACPTRGLLLGQHREGPLSLEGCHGPGSSQFVRHKLKVGLELTTTTESKLLQAKSTSVWEKPTSTCSSTLSFLWVQIPGSVLCLLYDFAQHSISCLCCSHVGQILKDEREKLNNKTFLFLIVKGPWIFLSVLNSNTHRPEFSHLSCFIAQLSKWENKWILETKSQAIWSKFHFCH